MIDFYVHVSFSNVDKSQNVYGQTSNTNDPNGTPDQSPIATNDDSGDASGNRIHDDIDDDDPFSKRRYGISSRGFLLFCICTFGLMNELSKMLLKQENGHWKPGYNPSG